MFDELDRAIVEALLNDGRASWVEIAREIGASVPTTRRRGTALIDGGPVLVSVLPTIDLFPEAHRMFEVRLQCAPGTERQVAFQLARRADTRWVAVVTGEFDVAAELLVAQGDDPASVLLDDLQLNPGVVRSHVAPILDSETISDDWSRRMTSSALRSGSRGPHVCDPTHLTAPDRAILDALKGDGRRTFVELAAELQMSETTVRRRFTEMIDQGCATVITLVQSASLGYEQELILRLDVAPADVEATRFALAAHHGVHQVATMIGPEALTCEILFETQQDLRKFMKDVLAPMASVRRVIAEIELVVYKRAFLMSPWVDLPGPTHLRRIARR
jgi:DNA-binding Lrp family transcriptional regulator